MGEPFVNTVNFTNTGEISYNISNEGDNYRYNNNSYHSRYEIDALKRDNEYLRGELKIKDEYIAHLKRMFDYSNKQIMASSKVKKPLLDENVSERVKSYVHKTVFKNVKFSTVSMFLDTSAERDKNNHFKSLGMEICGYLSQYPALRVPDLSDSSRLYEWWYPYG